MKFGPVPVADAQGAILAHATEAGAGATAYRIKKGTLLTTRHVDELGAAGVSEVIVARLGPDDLHEDEAATRISAALAGQGLTADRAATGRVNLRADAAGIVEIDSNAINRVNRIDPAITVATVPEWGRLVVRGLAATVKIIPFGVEAFSVDMALDVCAGAMHLRTPVYRTASLIETTVSAEVPSDKGRRAVEERLERLGLTLERRIVVPHTQVDIARAIGAARGELLLILTGSATSDINDVAPDAVRGAGGRVIHYGMPVDPGNLLFLGWFGPPPVAGTIGSLPIIGKAEMRPVIGLPGCARSPALNGADWVMERVICGVPLDQIDIPGMGVGGLLKEIPSRPRPREG